MIASTLSARLGHLLLLSVIALSFTPRAGAAQWVADGIPATSSSLAQEQPCVAPDGAGGAFVGWIDDAGAAAPDVYVQHFDAAGNRLWGATGILVCNAVGDRADPVIVPDGEGGCIVAWDDYRNAGGVPYGSDIYAQRVSFLGTPLWATNGVAVIVNINDQKFPRMIAGSGSTAFLAWQDLRSDTGDIYVQKLDADGTVLWGAGGIAVCTATDLQLDADIVTDGEGGVIVCWADLRSGFSDVYAQRVNFLGATAWTADGVAVSATTGIQSNADMIAHPLGGAMIVWEDQRSTSRDIYAQRVDAAGAAQWTTNGVVVCDVNDVQRNAQITSDGGSGGIIAWADFRDDGPGQIRAQRVDASGTRQWVSDGVPVAVTTSTNFEPQVVSNGIGGAIISWYGYYDMGPGNEDVYAQQLDASGSPLWAANGIPVCTATGGQSAVRMAGAGSGAAIVVWEDGRSASTAAYAQRIPFGVASGVGDGATPDAGLVVQANVPNPFSTGTSFRVHSGAPVQVTVEVFDVAGRRVATRRLALAAGWQSVRFDGRDDAGTPLPAGVYFHRVRTPDQTVTRKMLIVR